MPAAWMAGPGAAHGGMLADAARRFPDAPRPFLDLSTGINPVPYPLGDLPRSCFTRLPDPEDSARLESVAAQAYGVADPALVVAAPGTQILIGLLPHLLPRRGPDTVAVLSPTYGEHARAWANAGFEVREVDGLEAAEGFGRVVLCNPNNPDGRRFGTEELRQFADRLAWRGGTLIVDEAFADFAPAGTSLAPALPHPAIAVLRSFGKSHGLAGVRLGFLLADRPQAARFRHALGPWAVSGPALQVGLRALADEGWRADGMARLAADSARLDALLAAAGGAPLGGTALFRLYRHDQATALRDRLGQRGILVRGFAGHPNWLRFGLPAPEAWARLQIATCHGIGPRG